MGYISLCRFAIFKVLGFIRSGYTAGCHAKQGNPGEFSADTQPAQSPMDSGLFS
jgi:hypothetical protein